MTHTEGVLKKIELGGEEGNYSIYMEFIPYGETLPEKIAIDAQSFLEKLLKNEKIGMVCWNDLQESDDIVNIRGVAKDIPVIARY